MTPIQQANIFRAAFKVILDAIPSAHWCHRNKYELSWEPDGKNLRCRIDYFLHGIMHSEIVTIKDDRGVTKGR